MLHVPAALSDSDSGSASGQQGKQRASGQDRLPVGRRRQGRGAAGRALCRYQRHCLALLDKQTPATAAQPAAAEQAPPVAPPAAGSNPAAQSDLSQAAPASASPGKGLRIAGIATMALGVAGVATLYPRGPVRWFAGGRIPLRPLPSLCSRQLSAVSQPPPDPPFHPQPSHTAPFSRSRSHRVHPRRRTPR